MNPVTTAPDNKRKFTLAQFDIPAMQQRSAAFLDMMSSRRTFREFSSKPVPYEIIKNCIKSAATAPSGANRQPWHFAVVGNPELKASIRQGAEAEEREFYTKRAPQDWLDALAPLGTDANKPFLESAPYLIVIFGEKYVPDVGGNKQKNYYVTESVSIATGLLIAALHNVGLATLTHTPSPMKFLNNLLDRPAYEKPLLILVVGYPADNAKLPDITRKHYDEIVSLHL